MELYNILQVQVTSESGCVSRTFRGSYESSCDVHHESVETWIWGIFFTRYIALLYVPFYVRLAFLCPRFVPWRIFPETYVPWGNMALHVPGVNFFVRWGNMSLYVPRVDLFLVICPLTLSWRMTSTNVINIKPLITNDVYRRHAY